MNKKNWVLFSGFLWLLLGVWLLYKGLHFIAEGTVLATSLSFHLQPPFHSAQQAGTGLIALALFLGLLKGKFIFSKTVRKMVARIVSLPLPIRFGQVYAPSYWILIGSMVALGVALRFLPIPIDLRGCVDVTIGSALVRGAMFYFQAVRTL